MNRGLDEHLVPDDLVQTDKNVRLFSRLSAAFARFYLDAEPFYSAPLRKLVLVELATRVHKTAKREVLLSLVDQAIAAGHVESTCARDRGLLGMKDWDIARHVVEHTFPAG
jgi:hypothetical protein